jgi:acetylornithine deacetylase/succinyl-diaminopimelate desuccinylase-like protein
MSDCFHQIFEDESIAELTAHFRNLIRIDTTNPPGNETAAARYIADVFEREGIHSKIIEPAPNRGNIVARLNGDGSKRPLLLMGHLDVVVAEPDKWELPPFSAEIEKGCIWGRGTLDCKNSVALWMMVLILLKRSGIRPKRDVIFLATADEEADQRLGMEWMVDHHYELIDAESALSEGGGFGISVMDKTYYTYQSAEKGIVWLRITARGAAGHASVPQSDNPTPKLAAIVDKLSKKTFPLRVTPTVRKMIEIMAADQKFPLSFFIKQLCNPLLSDKILKLAVKDETIVTNLHAMLHNTLCPTVLRAGSKVNVIPSEACCEIDFRLLPGYSIDECYHDLKKTVGSGFEIDVIDARPANESPDEHSLADSIQKIMHQYQPQAGVLPYMLTGTSDACFLRPKGVVVYGFTPLLPTDDMSLVHNHNERISLESLEFSLKIGLAVVLDHIMEC